MGIENKILATKLGLKIFSDSCISNTSMDLKKEKQNILGKKKKKMRVCTKLPTHNHTRR